MEVALNDCRLLFGAEFKPRDCADLREVGHTESGVYLINPGDSDVQSNVYCDMNSSESWLVNH